MTAIKLCGDRVAKARAKFFLTFAMVLLLDSSFLAAQGVPYTDYNSDSHTYSSEIGEWDHPSDLDFENIFAALVTSSTSKLEHALANLKRVYPDYVRGYTLMYYSRSLQGASFENPRAIVYGRNARTIISFNGSPDQAGYDALETLEFKDDAYQLREILFVNEDPKHPHHLPTDEIDRNLSTEKVEVTKANIPRCLTCHSEIARPIWDNYFLWPGAYGSQDDQLFRPTTAGNELFVDNEAGERSEYDHFVSVRLQPKWPWQKPHPRYSQLGETRLKYLGEVRPNAGLNAAFVSQALHRVAGDLRTQKKVALFSSVIRSVKESTELHAETLDYNLDVVMRQLALVGKHIKQQALIYGQDRLGPLTLKAATESEAFEKMSEKVPKSLNDIGILRNLHPELSWLTIGAAAIRNRDNSITSTCLEYGLRSLNLNLRDYAVNRERSSTMNSGYDLCQALDDYLKSL